MRILVVSDTHGNENALLQAFKQAGETDLLIHIGDGENDTLILKDVYKSPVIRVAGNCDMGSKAPKELILSIEEKQVLITHGDRHYVKSGIETLAGHGYASCADIVLYGHTHIPLAEQRENLLLLNPGALCMHRGTKTFAVINIQKESVEYSFHVLD